MVYVLLLNFALGYSFKVDGIIASYLIFYLSFLFSKKFFYFLLILNSVVGILYLPISVLYGSLSFGIVASFFETNLNESIEFVLHIPYLLYCYSVLFSLFVIFLIKFFSRYDYLSYSKKVYFIMIALIISLVLYKPLKEFYKNKENQFYFSDTNVSIIGFYAKLVDAVNQYTVYKADSLTSIDIEPTWEILESKPQYSNYILVIGESMRADYTSMYGYTIDTTPFLANTKGILFSNYISTAGNTQPSLLRTLYRNKEPINYQDNIITLAKKSRL